MASKGHKKEEARQLPPLPPDPLGEKLVRLGLVANAYLLDINMALQAHDTAEMPEPWSLPSRLMRFPIRVSVPSHGAPRRLTLTHAWRSRQEAPGRRTACNLRNRAPASLARKRDGQ